MVHTEKVHVMFGLLAAVSGAAACVAAWRPERRWRIAWQVLAMIIGVLLFIPVEGHTLTYQPVGWWATILSAIPTDRVHWIPNWLDTLSVRHVLQHKIGSGAVILMAAVEFLRDGGRLRRPAWGLVLPALLVAAGIAFGIHGNTPEHLPTRAEQAHHWMLGVVLTFGGVTLGLARAGVLRGRAWHALWAAGVLLSGLDLAFRYRLQSIPPTTEAHEHASPGPRLR